MIYLASPYSHPDPEVRVQRFNHACLAAGRLMAEGRLVFSPIVHCHPISEQCTLPSDFAYWAAYDREMLTRLCDSLLVLMLDGWEMSIGVQAEIEIMRELRRPIEYLEWP